MMVVILPRRAVAELAFIGMAVFAVMVFML
jgi:hypothetical protein